MSKKFHANRVRDAMRSQRLSDDAIVLAALPGALQELWLRPENSMEYDEIRNALRRLKRVNLALYVRATKRWEKVL